MTINFELAQPSIITLIHSFILHILIVYTDYHFAFVIQGIGNNILGSENNTSPRAGFDFQDNYIFDFLIS